jgi:hypothetical protein
VTSPRAVSGPEPGAAGSRLRARSWMSAAIGRTHLPALVAWVALMVLEAILLAMARAIEGFWSFGVALVLFATSAGSTGLLIRVRRPGNVVGRLLAFGPVLMIVGFSGFAVAVIRWQTNGPDDIPGGLAGAVASAATLPGIALTFPAVGIVFPDGRLPGRRWGLLIRLIAATFMASSVTALVTFGPDSGLPRNPLALTGLPPWLAQAGSAAGTIALFATVLLAFAAVTVRFRRARGLERQQLKWFAAAVTLASVGLPISWLTDIGPAELIDLMSLVLAALVPVAIGVAIFRYRLYDIDRIISRTVSYGAVTGILALVFVGTILVSQTVLASFFSGNSVAVAASTLVVAALFQPLRRRVQRVVDRRFNRSRYEAERTVAAFGAHLRDEVDLGTLRRDLVATIDQTLQPTLAGVWLRGDGR